MFFSSTDPYNLWFHIDKLFLQPISRIKCPCRSCQEFTSKTWPEFQCHLYICTGGYYKVTDNNLQNISNSPMEKCIPFETYTHFVPNLCLEKLKSTKLSSLKSCNVGKQGKLDILSVKSPSVVTVHNSNQDMEEEYKSESLILDRGRTDIFGLLKSKLLRLKIRK